MVTEVLKGIYMISLPFMRRRVKSIDEIKLYVIKGEERNILIDTGLNEEEYHGTLMKDLEEIGVSMENTDIFLTHMHPDHSGLLVKLKTPTNHIIAVEEEARLANALRTDEYWTPRYQKYLTEGLPMTYDQLIASHPACEFFAEADSDFVIMKEGDTLDIGDYSFRLILTPGHSPAHTCLYDEKTKTLISGDVILSHAASILFFEEGMDDPLGEYLNSLSIVEKLEIENILPCHANINFNVYERIEELRQHYAKKMEEITAILKEHGPLNAWQTAEYTIKLEIPKELSAVSDVSKWFFYLPTCMALTYMREKGMVKAERDENGINVYSA